MRFRPATGPVHHPEGSPLASTANRRPPTVDAIFPTQPRAPFREFSLVLIYTLALVATKSYDNNGVRERMQGERQTCSARLAEAVQECRTKARSRCVEA